MAYPTDTVYGLGADIYNDEAVRRILQHQGPSPEPAFAGVDSGCRIRPECLTGSQPKLAQILMKRFWPGGLTIILDKSPEFNSLVLAGGHKIGIRMPAHKVARAMIEKLGRPIVGTSANLHDRQRL